MASALDDETPEMEMIALLLLILATDNIIEPQVDQPVGPMILIFETQERGRWEV